VPDAAAIPVFHLHAAIQAQRRNVAASVQETQCRRTARIKTIIISGDRSCDKSIFFLVSNDLFCRPYVVLSILVVYNLYIFFFFFLVHKYIYRFDSVLLRCWGIRPIGDFIYEQIYLYISGCRKTFNIAVFIFMTVI